MTKLDDMIAEILCDDKYLVLDEYHEYDEHASMTNRMKALADKLLTIQPNQHVIRAMSDIYDPTWGYASETIGLQWARTSFLVAQDELRKELEMK